MELDFQKKGKSVLCIPPKNKIKINRHFNGIPFSISFESFVEGVVEELVLDDEGDRYIKIVEASDGSRHDHYIKEGEIVNIIQNARKNIDGIIINAAAFTHTSVALHDSLEIKKIPNLINTTLQLKGKIQRLAGLFYQFDSIDFLGRQYMYPLAMESALKLKELTYINSHAYAAGELKHGPLATVYEGKPFFFLAPQESLREKNISNMKEIKARGGTIILLKQKNQEFPKDCFDFSIEIPKAPSYILPIISAIPLQMFAMYMAQKKGLNVDKPRNLAKSVTVE